MKKEIAVGAYRMLADIEKTRAWYAKQPREEWCVCSGCRNMARVFRSLPPAVDAVFASFGVDPMCPARAAHYAGKCVSSDASTVFSSAWYHICGELTEGSRASEDGRFADEYGEHWPLQNGWTVVFKKECDLLAEDFPRPCFQMEIFCTIPWVLDEPNTYLVSPAQD